MQTLRCTAVMALLGLSACADVTGGEGWSVSRAAAQSLRKQGCGNNVLDNPTLAHRMMTGGTVPGGAPVLGCALRMGNSGPG
ncbi:hypothetical protein JYK14_18350 [Siccirubricoccus sp. KC 17139]|uniref:Lipoprotein n=1 Tax=Siccirubricoccus soli TaxID=2899147 RepID=A0ABT1D834_9PROT|nr:hypothetical protein [Siccirubricoccus soli]MCO6418108.1 hypothetical protein [Siccirubricoccus soli]MCP2684243.1 hypothetical protein [Siccirubricoccus soli]